MSSARSTSAPKSPVTPLRNGSLYVLRGQEQPNEDWRIARVNPQEETPTVEDIAVVPFASRSLTFDGETFWSNYRAKDTIISFALPN